MSGADKRHSKSESVVAHVRSLLWTGALRPGDKIDQDVLASRLGVSRIPVREALIQMERDGIIRMDFHRGASVARFDADTVRENYGLYAELTSHASAKVAAARDAEVVWELQRIEHAMRRPAGEPREIERLAIEFRRVIHRAGGGVRFRAIIRALMLYVPRSFLADVPEAIGLVRDGCREELRAIEAGDAQAARATAVEMYRACGDLLVDFFQRRGVLEPSVPAAYPEPGSATAG